MQISHVIDSLEIGGMERMLEILASHQSTMGHQVRVGCLLREGAIAKNLRSRGIEVECFHKKAGLDLDAIRRMHAWFKSARGTVIHTHNPVPHYYAALASVGTGNGTLINTRHDMGIHARSSRATLLYKLALARTFRAVLVCQAAKAQFLSRLEIPANKCAVIPNGIELENISGRNVDLQRALKREFGIAESSIVLGTVGRLNPVKDQRQMIECTAELISRGLDVCLVMIGDGACRQYLENQTKSLKITEQVYFLGERSDVHRLLPIMDVFLLTSKTEGYSMALVEAAASGLPVIASNVGGNSEIVTHASTGYLYPPDQPEELSSLSEKLVRDESLRHALGAQAHAWAHEHGSTHTMYENYQSLYRRQAH